MYHFGLQLLILSTGLKSIKYHINHLYHIVVILLCLTIYHIYFHYVLKYYKNVSNTDKFINK